MALTDDDLFKIKHLFDDKFDHIDTQFTAVRGDIDSLAIAAAQQFEFIEQQFRAVDARFNDVDSRFDGVDARFTGVDARFNGVDAQFDGIRAELGNIKDDLVVVKDMSKDHTFRISRLEHQLRPAS